METTVENLGEKISRLRNAKGWSQEKLATESGAGRRTIQKIESGETESPGVDVVVDIAHALDVSISSLLDDKPLRSELILEIIDGLRALSLDHLETIKMTVINLNEIQEGEMALNSKSNT